MNPRIVGQIILLLLFATQISFSAGIRTVSKSADDGGQYRTISEAVNAAEPGDEIVIKDFGVYEEQVTINKNKITLRSEDPALAKKPTIKWKDTKNVGPKTGAEAQIDSLITFDQNGALRVMRCQGVTINGIIVDGGGSAPFAYTGIWNNKDPLFHGNAAITLWIAGDVTIKNCELQNAYFGLNVKDRNEGGIFANANPADLEKWKVVPLSGFGKTGNHIIERNRIHNNDVGMFFESSWDLGSVIRYNLIYENHHAPTDYAKIKAMPDGGNQPGGAIMFKDNLLSPLAIYNNTFWHNSLLIIGHWKAGHQHLIFNNLFAEPYTYWSKVADLTDWMDLDPKFTLRSHNNLYAAQKQAPERRTQTYNVNAPDRGTNNNIEVKKNVTGVQGIQLMNGMTKWEIEGEMIEMVFHFSDSTDSVTYVRAEWIIQPGARCLDFPKDADVRWLETKFKSTDPTNANFLVPDWDDPVMKKFIVDGGWVEGGIYDSDGSIADIGAIPFTGKYPETVVMVKPTDAVVINKTTATASFNLSVLAGSFNNPKIEYVKWIDALPYDKDAFGGVAKLVLKSDNVRNATPTPTNLKVGINQISFEVPTRTDANGYAFLELVVSGTNDKGEKVSSMVGFLPFRNLAYKFLVQIFSKNDVTFKNPLKEVKAGEVVVMRVVPQDSSGKALTAHIDTAEATLNSSYILYNDQLKKFTFPRDFVGEQKYDVVFTKVPDNGSLEIVSVSGKFLVNTKDTIGNAIRGSSDGIKILPGDPDSVKFYDPASGGVKVVNPGISATIIAKVYDKYGNLVDKSGQADVKLTSSAPTIGDVDGPSTVTSDDTGTVYFKVKITNGKLNDTFPLVATLVTNSKTDQVFGVVGKNRDKFKIFYSDTVGGYNESAKIEGSAGERFPVTITAGNDSADIIATRNSSFIIDFQEYAGILAAYKDPTDTVPIQGSKLVNGKTVIWITSTGKSVSNGQIVIYADSDNTILKGSRYNIFFTEPTFIVDRGAYFADNGFGQVDRLELYYKDTLKDNTSLPDTIELYWPLKSDVNKKIVFDKSSMTLDATNKKHVTVKLNDPFDSCVTASSGAATYLGATSWINPAAPQSVPQRSSFGIADSVGPLLKSATLVERLKEGDDTLFITFSEAVNPALIVGKTLQVIKRSGADTIDMDISAAVAIGGDTIRIVAKNAAGDSPESGDLLKINSSGTITDMYGNKAHKDNRPVAIKQKAIPAEIASAEYYDKDGNGIVDYLTIRFTKKVDRSKFQVKGVWEQNSNGFKDTILTGDRLEKGADDFEFGVNVTGAFLVEPKDVTSGPFYVEVRNLDFPGIKIPGKQASDKAAPVIVSAIYYPGEAISQCQSASDTLVVTFSENVKMPAFDPLTFNFKHNTDSYTVTLDKILSENGKQIKYLVKDPEVFPVNGDMINIRENKIADDKNNLQAIPDNKWVTLKVQPVEYKAIVNVGPNPFKAGNEKIKIQIEALTKMKEVVKIESEMVIYDKMGNVIKTFDKGDVVKFDSKDKCTGKDIKADGFIWDGTNKNGRYVGAGTYVAKIKVVDKNPENNAPPQNPKVYVGVKR